MVWGSGSVRALGYWDCQNGVLGSVLFQEKPSLPCSWAGSLQVCSLPVPCACWLSHSVGMGTKGGLHPGPIPNCALAPAAAAQRCLQGKYGSTAASGCRDSVSAQKSPLSPSRQLWLWLQAINLPVALWSCCHESSQRLGKSFGVLHPAVVLLIIIPS